MGSSTCSIHMCVHLRYYVVDFCKEQDAVSIRQREKLDRKSRMWGEGRLAVEGVASVWNTHNVSMCV